MNAVKPAPVIAHHFGARVTGLLKQRWPGHMVHESDPARPWSLPSDTSVLLSGPSRTWSGGPAGRPDDWPAGLTWIQLPGAGADLYPRWLLASALVTTARGVNSVSIAEFVLASMLAHAKRFPSAWITRREDWRTVHMATLDGKTLGLLGFGSVAQEVAQRALAFGLKLVVHRRSTTEPLPPGVARAASFAALLAEADYLVLAAPHTPDTHHIINQRTIAAMKPGIHIVNVARGGLIDQDALLAGLDDGRVGSVSIDVTDPEPLPAGHRLYTHPRVQLSPHVAWNSPDTLDRLVAKFNQNMERFIEGRPLLDPLQ
jgi:phosphoglycerate dehydrogenase-like enzyme